jgi:hypothetical protein
MSSGSGQGSDQAEFFDLTTFVYVEVKVLISLTVGTVECHVNGVWQSVYLILLISMRF